MPATKHVVALFSLVGDSIWEEFAAEHIAELAEEFSIVHIRKLDEVHDFLSESPPHAIIMTDPELASPSHNTLSNELVDFVKGGGIAIMAESWSTSVRHSDANSWFRTVWSLPWRFGDYHRTTVHLNEQFSNPDQMASSLLANYSQKAIFLQHVTRADGLYWPSTSSRVESMVFGPSPVEQQQCPVAFTKIGEGYLGYIGDVNSEEGSRAAIRAMCRVQTTTTTQAFRHGE